MDINRYTQKAQEALAGAQALAGELNCGQMEPFHLLLALLRQSDSVVLQILQKLEARPAEVRSEIASSSLDWPSRRGR